MKILVAVDGSEASVHAANTAFLLTKNTSGAVSLIHVSPPFAPVVTDMASMMPDPSVEIAKAGQTLLQHALATIKAPADTTLIHRIGAPAEVIADVAVEGGYDLVVVGHTGRGAVARVLLGSVADRLVHICEKPVLVVR